MCAHEPTHPPRHRLETGLGNHNPMLPWTQGLLPHLETRTRGTDLPGADVGGGVRERTLVNAAEFEGVAANFGDVVEQRPERRRREDGREEEHIAELQEHLQVVVHRVLPIVRSVRISVNSATKTQSGPLGLAMIVSFSSIE